jgi:regulatory protein
VSRVTALTAQRGRRDRINVYLEGRFAFGLAAEAAAQAGLAVGQDLDDDDLARLQGRDHDARLYDDALRFLSFRPRSESETVRYLRRRGADSATLDALIERLRRAGLIDDDAFARFWIENRTAFSPRGARALRAELRAKGVAHDEIDAALENAPTADDELAYQAGLKRMRVWARLDADVMRERAYGYLRRRGFDDETARAVTERLQRERDDQP